MIHRPLAALTQAYPSETHLENRLRDLTARDRAAAVDHFSLVLPEFDVLIALPDAETIGSGLAHLRGTPTVLAPPEVSGVAEACAPEHLPVNTPDRWTFTRPGALPTNIRTAVIVSQHLKGGLPELLTALLAARQGWTVQAVAVVVERTNNRGRTRLELQGMTVRAALQLADTPRGLELERRIPHLN
ncbi:hypothetical protein [Deinococcus arenicola]|uniref:Uncharacterized protein n=1 Tax=Deinococcus arenicola TaxID=2994950 RepID=A0ABU4DLY7_9DEIO|nr:hypothetical protein [Deinococcus sp. ZS9-10]MDV6373437.1 hypothetical protein [Deinococcus sp. ZS9-10]